MNTPKHYIARWHDPTNLGTIASVSFIATSEKQAHNKARKIAVQIGLPNTPYTLN
jgi:hypothetical protein